MPIDDQCHLVADQRINEVGWCKKQNMVAKRVTRALRPGRRGKMALKET
jgi:hypothetical protein